MVSSTRVPREFSLYPMALMMSGLCYLVFFCFGRNLMGIMVGWLIASLSFCSPSSVGSMDCREWSYYRLVFYVCVCDLKSFTGFLPRSVLRIGHLPPIWVSRRSCRILKVLLCLVVLSRSLY